VLRNGTNGLIIQYRFIGAFIVLRGCMSKKKYFWLKLHKDFFKSKEIKKLRRVAGGDTFVIIYLKMQLLSIEANGLIEYEEIEPTFAEELALELDEDDTNVNATLLFLESMGMLKEVDETTFSIPHVVDLIGSETPQARTMRKKRAIENQSVTDKNVTLLQDSYTDVKKCEKNVTLEIEKELDIEKDIKTTTPKKACVYSEEFLGFWEFYKKGNKKKSFDQWKKLNPQQVEEIRQKVTAYVKSTDREGMRYRKNAEVYLNPVNEHWNNEIQKDISKSATTKSANHVVDEQYNDLGF